MIVKIVREKNDPVLRISIGGTPDLGYYLVLRGQPQEAISCLDILTEALRHYPDLREGQDITLNAVIKEKE